MGTKAKNRFYTFCLTFLTVLCLACGIGGHPAKAEETQQEMSFVLVTDVSNTMSKSDTRGLGKDAMSMFLDMLPVERTKVGILTFGHSNTGNAYPYTDSFLPSTPEHPAFVHRVAEQLPLSENREELKTRIREIVWNGEQTPIEAALLAGCDALSVSGVGENAGCVILLTDGDYKSRYITDVQNVKNDLDRAVTSLNENGWYVYCIELDYALNAQSRASAHAFLTENITDRCNGETYEVEDAGDVGTAFLEILNNLYGTGSMETGMADADGYLTRELAVGDLTSEANITVIGNSILGVELLSSGEVAATVGSFSSDSDETSYDKNQYGVELGKIYCNIKRLLPEQGAWTVRVRTEAGSRIVTNVVCYSDLVLQSEIKPDDTTPGKPLTKADAVSAMLFISYHGKNIARDSLGGAKAYVHLTNQTTGEELSLVPMEWSEEKSAFFAEIPVADLGRAGELTAVCELKFGDGEVRRGKEVRIYTHNEPLVLTDSREISLEGELRTQLEPLDISGKYKNPDLDLISAELVFPQEETDAKAEISGDGKQLKLSTGNRAGEFAGELLLWDADMGKEGALRIPVCLTVSNHPMEMKEIEKVDLLAEHVLETQLDLNSYYADEDQAEPVFYLEEGSDPEVAELSLNGSLLTVKAVGDGTTEAAVYAMDDDGQLYRNSFTVTGATEGSIRNRKIREFWEKTSAAIIGLGLLVFAALLVYLYIQANTKLRGTWKIVISAPGKKDYIYELNTATDVAKKDRKHSVLRRVLDLESLPAEHPAVAELLDHSEALNYVRLAGVFREEGCKITAKAGVKMLINGEESCSAKLGARDEAMILIPGEDGNTAVSIRITV